MDKYENISSTSDYIISVATVKFYSYFILSIFPFVAGIMEVWLLFMSVVGYEAEVERGVGTVFSILSTSFQMATAPHNRTTPIIRRVVRLIFLLPFMIELHRPS
jgi:hypothetical protein